MCLLRSGTELKGVPSSFNISERVCSDLLCFVRAIKCGVIFSLFNLSKVFMCLSSLLSCVSSIIASSRSRSSILFTFSLKFFFNTFISPSRLVNFALCFL